MTRREFITLLGGAAAWPLAAQAQQIERMQSVGVLMTFGADEVIGQTRVAALLQGLQQAGWEVGRNLRIELRWSGANPADIRKHALELSQGRNSSTRVALPTRGSSKLASGGGTTA